MNQISIDLNELPEPLRHDVLATWRSIKLEQPDAYVTPQEACHLFRLKYDTFRHLVHRGKIQVITHPRHARKRLVSIREMRRFCSTFRPDRLLAATPPITLTCAT